MNKKITSLLVFIGLAAGTSPSLRAAVAEMIHYQGYLTVAGSAFDGPGEFKFALIDGAGATTFWSHDGSSVGGAAPTGAITNIPVNKGLYSVLLGDKSVTGMTRSIPASVFTANTDVFLRVWFNDGVNGLLQLVPDTRIASVGFALVAATVADGAVSSTSLKPNITLGGGNTAGTLTLESGGDQTRAVLDAGLQNGSASLKLYDATGTFDTARLVGAESGGTTRHRWRKLISADRKSQCGAAVRQSVLWIPL